MKAFMFSIFHRRSTGIARVWFNSSKPMERSACMLGVSWRWIAIILLSSAVSVPAQEALQNMVAGQTAASDRNTQMTSQNQDYTLKKGDFRLLVVPSLGLQWNDNINLARTNVLDDYIVTPTVGITASYPFSQNNLLYLDFTVGYNWYLKHSQFSSFDLNSSSGTGLSFDFVIKDFTINLHDWINYTQGAGQNAVTAGSASATVANTANYGTFQNTLGLLGTWDLNQVTLSLGYDHQNVMSTSGQFDEINHSAEMLNAQAGFQVHPQITVGLQATAAFTAYDKALLNNNNAYTVGPYVEFRPGKAFTVTARGGYSYYQFLNTSTNIQTPSQNGWYASLAISHQPFDILSYTLEVGREVQLGTVSDLVEDWYVRPNATWKIIKDVDINTYFFYEHGNQGEGSTGSLPGVSDLNGTFDWYGGGAGFQYAFSRRFSLGVNYQITRRSSDAADGSYIQNLVSLQLSYHPK